jgi:mRNA interferase MazF
VSQQVETDDIVLVDLNPVAGREQAGRRPVLVVSHRRCAAIPGLFLGVALTSTDGRLPHNVRVKAGGRTGLHQTSYAMTEQVRALSLGRIDQHLGDLDQATFGLVSRYVHLVIG